MHIYDDEEHTFMVKDMLGNQGVHIPAHFAASFLSAKGLRYDLIDKDHVSLSH